jgi:hypothetical protein
MNGSDPLKMKSTPCAVCGRPVKRGDGVWLQDGRRICLDELSKPLPKTVPPRGLPPR